MHEKEEHMYATHQISDLKPSCLLSYQKPLVPIYVSFLALEESVHEKKTILHYIMSLFFSCLLSSAKRDKGVWY